MRSSVKRISYNRMFSPRNLMNMLKEVGTINSTGKLYIEITNLYIGLLEPLPATDMFKEGSSWRFLVKRYHNEQFSSLAFRKGLHDCVCTAHKILDNE